VCLDVSSLTTVESVAFTKKPTDKPTVCGALEKTKGRKALSCVM